MAQTDTSYDARKPNRETTTHATASTLSPGKAALASGRASQTDKTQAIRVGNLGVASASVHSGWVL